MSTYADPRRCPDCGGALPQSPSSCPVCGLTLTGPVAAELYRTLLSADQLLARLRQPLPAQLDRSGDAPPAPEPGSVSLMEEPAQQASQRRPPASRLRLSGASVPKILLTLGALCLLVAAVVFLAVAWSWLGVGGRTAVLVLFTAAAGTLAWWLGNRGLRIAGEALSVVAFGLLALDVLGADNAGWLGQLSSSGLTAAVGLTLGAAGLLAAGLSRVEHRLVAPQLVAALGVWLVPLGVAGTTEHDELVFVLAVAASAGMAAGAHRRQFTLLAGLLAAVAATWWLALATSGLIRLADHPSVNDVWLHADAWPALAAAAFAGVAAWLLRRLAVLPQACASAAAVLVALTVAAPVIDETATRAVAVLLALTVVAALATFPVARSWRSTTVAPMLVLFTAPVVVALTVTTEVLDSVTGLSSIWGSGAGVRLPAPDLSAEPIVPVAVAAVGALVVAALAALSTDRPGSFAREHAVTLGGGVAAAGLVTAAAYGGPLATLPLGLAAVSLAMVLLAGTSSVRAGVAATVLATGVALVATWSSLPSAGLTLLTLALVAAASAWVAFRGSTGSLRVLGSATTVVVLAGVAWTVGELVGVDVPWRATLVIILVGGVAVALPHVEWEAPAGVCAVLAVAGSMAVGANRFPQETLAPLALMLTVAGALVTATSLVHPTRRLAGWLGGLLLAMATWVRLYDLGIETPELYTLPSAVALCLVGLQRLRRDETAATLTSLAPGLVLATVPSLVRVAVAEPVSPRALLLGLGCLALVLAGVRLRWTAPVVVGGAVGALLVICELGPYAAQLPPWLLIALAGTTLTVVGVTWESRMREMRGAASYLAHLR